VVLVLPVPPTARTRRLDRVLVVSILRAVGGRVLHVPHHRGVLEWRVGPRCGRRHMCHRRCDPRCLELEIEETVSLEAIGRASEVTDPAMETGRGARAIVPASAIVRASVEPGQVVAIDR
jgi:hypothetical protein